MKQFLFLVAILFECTDPVLAQSTRLAEQRALVEAWSREPMHPAGDTIGLQLMGDLTVMYMMRSNYDSALVVATNAALAGERILAATTDMERNKDVRELLYNVQGFRCMLLRDHGAFDEAIDVGRTVLGHAELLGTADRLAEAYKALSLCHVGLDDVGTALLWTRKQLAVVDTSDRLSRSQVLFEMGDQYGALGLEDSAFYFLHSSRAVLDSSMTPVVFTEPLFRIIALHQQAGRTDSVAKYLGLVVRHLNFGSYPKMEVQWLLAKAGLQTLTREYGEAISTLRQADAVSLVIRDHRLRYKVQRALSIALAAHGDPVSAALHADTAVKEMKLVMKVAAIRHLARTQAEMVHAQELALAAAQVDVQRGQKHLAIVGGVALVILLLLALLLFRSARQKATLLTTKNAEIIQAQSLLIASEKQREVEQVRTRIARDIHDEVGSELTRISMLGGEVKRRLSTSESLANEGVDQIRLLTRQVSATLSDVVWAVDPQQDTVHSLVRHAEGFARRMLEPFGAKAGLLFTATGDDRPLDPLMKNNVFLVLKEAVNNAMKYASAERLEVEMVTDRRSYRVRVKDSGPGFDPVGMVREGNGLRNMQARAAQLGAELSIVAAPGSGTEVLMTGSWS